MPDLVHGLKVAGPLPTPPLPLHPFLSFAIIRPELPARRPTVSRFFAPRGEVDIFAKPAAHFRKIESYIVCDNIWDHFGPMKAALVTPLLDHQVLQLAGMSIAGCRCRVTP
jgi:hypothetical protein